MNICTSCKNCMVIKKRNESIDPRNTNDYMKATIITSNERIYYKCMILHSNIPNNVFECSEYEKRK